MRVGARWRGVRNGPVSWPANGSMGETRIPCHIPGNIPCYVPGHIPGRVPGYRNVQRPFVPGFFEVNTFKANGFVQFFEEVVEGRFSLRRGVEVRHGGGGGRHRRPGPRQARAGCGPALDWRRGQAIGKRCWWRLICTNKING